MITDIISAETGHKQGSNSEYHLAPNVVLLRLQDGTARLFDLGGNFYALSQTATAMLSTTLKKGVAPAASEIASIYAVTLECIQSDLHALLHDLETKRLIYGARHTASVRASTYIVTMLFRLLLHKILMCRASFETKVWTLLTLAYFSLHLLGWPTTITTWQRTSRGRAPFTLSESKETTIRMINEVVRNAESKHFLRIACKERALCCWFLLCATGLPAKLMVGIRSCPITSHCWCELEHTLIGDEEDRCEQFTPIVRFE